ncbi:MAG TPA: cystathionine beta-lyase [Hyphomonadaceae bacterium]|nr:cystathionine beta-lyase [Hyphomonadaceae bacterium]
MSSGPKTPGPSSFRKGKLSTRLAHAARDRKLTQGGVNPVVQRASTVIVESADKLFAPGGWTYGRHGTATHEALKQALMEVEEAEHCALAPSGLMACTVPFLAHASSGDHVLVGDNIYGPTRRFCDRTLKRWGCEAEYFDTTIGADIARLIRPNTRLIFLESPGSMTFEIADAPAIAIAAKAAGVVTAMDNTWSAGVFYKPLALGFDLSIQANTKYVSGGADVINGAILTNREDLIARLKETIADLGLNVSPDDASTTLRGLRTLETRMARHQAGALDIARWLKKRPEVQRVLHPALDDDPGHALWKRDFSGSSGLFSVVLKPASTGQVNAFLDRLELFGLGFSYGGFESLAIYCDPQLKRSATKPSFGGPLIRLSIGLEDPADLIADLEQAFSALA